MSPVEQEGTWRSLLEARGKQGPESEPLAGDIDLLVPLEPHWRALDLSGGCGARAWVLAHHCREVVATVHDPLDLTALEARMATHPMGPGHVQTRSLGLTLPPDLGDFELVVLEEGNPWQLEQIVPFLRPGGWVIWLLEGAAPPPVGRRSFSELLHGARAAADWAQHRLSAPARWRAQLNRLGFEDAQLYIHVREYAWGYLPFDAYWLQRYYLEAMQEEGQGSSRGKARVARLLGKGGLYPFLASAHVAVARLDPEAR